MHSCRSNIKKICGPHGKLLSTGHQWASGTGSERWLLGMAKIHHDTHFLRHCPAHCMEEVHHGGDTLDSCTAYANGAEKWLITKIRKLLSLNITIKLLNYLYLRWKSKDHLVLPVIFITINLKYILLISKAQKICPKELK